MGRFDSINFTTLTSDGQDNDIFNAKFKNMRFNIPTAKTITLTIADENNLPGLAEKYLGDKSLWWALLEYNGLYDAIEDVKAGNVLRIPSRTSLITYLETTTETSTNLIL